MNNWNSSNFFTLFSVVLVLTLLGIYGALTLHAGSISNILKENINLILEIENNPSKAQIESIINNLKNFNEIKSETIKFIPKSQALSQMNRELGNEFLLNEIDNPFSDVIIFNVNSDFVDNDNLLKVKSKVEALDHVLVLNYYDSVYEYLGANFRRISTVLLIIGLILAFFAFSLIYSTIQLNLYAERFKIRTMELVGASWNQIRKPFIAQSLKLAFKSTIISICILLVLILFLIWQFNNLWAILNLFYICIVFVLMALISVIITQLASYFVVNKYLGADKSKFY